MKKKWVGHLAFSNIKKHMKRNIFSILSLVVGLTSSFLIIGFSLNAEKSIKEKCYRQLEYGCLTITKENKSESTNGGLSIIRNSRPTFEEMKLLSSKLNDYEVDLNFDALVPTYSQITYGKKQLKDFSFECVYSFDEDYINRRLLSKGTMPNDGLDYVLVNEKLANDFSKGFGSTIIGKTFNISHECEYPYYFDNGDVTNDYFSFSVNVTVVGVVEDLSFLSTPKIYYSYLGLKDYLYQIYLNNVSEYLGRDYSWVDRVADSNGSDPVSAYTYRLFLKNHENSHRINELAKTINEPYSINSPSEIRTEALLGLINAATTGMELFLIIALVGTALIMGIVSFSFYSEDRKVIAILSCLGAKMDDINSVYCFENILIAFLSFILSIMLAPILQLITNLVVERLLGYQNIVAIPFLRFYGIPLGLPLIVFFGTLLISICSVLLPISFSKKISLKEELKDE